MTDLTDLTATSVSLNSQDLPPMTTEEFTGAGPSAITIKHGVVRANRAGQVDLTLADPVATTDDFKRLIIIAIQAQVVIVTADTSFGGGGAGENVATFSGAAGDTLALIAYQGKWYVTGGHQVTVA